MQVLTADEGTQVQQSREAIEAIDPSGKPEAMPRQIQFHWQKPDGEWTDKVYVQAQLGMFPIQEFTTMVTEKLNSFTEGEMGQSIGDLFRGDVDMPVSMDPDAVQDAINDNMQLIKAFVKLVQMLPDFQLDVMILSLGVPRIERNWAKECLQEPPHRGGPSVEEGMDILKSFIYQNAVLLKETFLGKARELVDVFQLEVLGREPETTSSDSTDSTETVKVTMPGPPSSPGGTPSNTSFTDIPESV